MGGPAAHPGTLGFLYASFSERFCADINPILNTTPAVSRYEKARKLLNSHSTPRRAAFWLNGDCESEVAAQWEEE